MATKLSEQAAVEVKRLVEKAAPHRIEISETLGKKMRFLRQSFVLHFVKDINKKKDREEYIETKIKQEKIFRKIKDFICFEGQGSEMSKYDGLNKLDDLLEEVSSVVQYLRYIGHTENLDSILAKYGMTLTTRDITNVYPVLAEEVVKDNIIKVFASASKTQQEAISEAQSICNIFDEMDDFIKYDSKTNKSGLKVNDFNKLTNLEALKQKSEEMVEKKFESLKDSIDTSIASGLNVQTVAQVIVDQSED